MAENMNEMDMGADIYTLVDEDGVEQQFEMLDVMEANGETYYALVPYVETPDDVLGENDELVILKMAEVDGEETLVTIDSEEEYNEIGNKFIERLNEMFDEDNE